MIKKIHFTGLLIACLLLWTGCGEDTPEVNGCTDPAANNYNPNATSDNGSCTYNGCTDSRAENYDPNATNDDGSCVFPNEKFIASYTGSFGCDGLFSVINQDTVEFEITEPVDPDEKAKVTISFVVTGLPISLEATVDGNDLTFDDITLTNIPFELGGIMVEADITFSGGATIDGDLLTATLTVSAMTSGLELVDTCTLTGNKN